MNKLRSLLLPFVCGVLSAPGSVESVTPEPSSTPPPPMITNPESPTGTVGDVYGPFQFRTSNGAAPLTWSETPSLNMGLSLSSSGVLSGTPTKDGKFSITLKVTDALNRSASASTTVRVSLPRPPSIFTKTGSLGMPRSGHAATLLLTGEVLVTGGGHGGPDATAELYDPGTGNFSPTAGHMTEARSGHTATLLSNADLPNYGKVLIVGSVGTSAELYNPVSSTFAATGSMHHARTSPTATLLNTGKVLIVGGNTDTADLRAELYDPATGTFSNTGSTTILRSGHAAAFLIDGRVLITGGHGAAGPTAEIYNPTTGTFTPTAGHMTESRSGHTATLLGTEDGIQDGSVLIVGTDGSADLYNPNTETFTRVGSLITRPSYGHTASLINDRGAVLIAGGYSFRSAPSPCGSFAYRNSEYNAALFASESDGFTVTGHLNTPRDGHTATVLSDGITVLVVGGTQRGLQFRAPNFCNVVTDVLSSAELFKTATATHLSVSAPNQVQLANPLTLIVTARDAANNLVASYTGTVHFSSTDAQAVLPGNSTLTNGMGVFSATLRTAGTQTIRATDTVEGSISGTSNAIEVVTNLCRTKGEHCSLVPGTIPCCQGLRCTEINPFFPIFLCESVF